MQGFDRFTEQMEKFVQSSLFKTKFTKFIALLENYGDPIKSWVIEAELGICGSQVRELTKYARRTGHLICSNENGYFIGTPTEMQETLHHMSERASSILFTSQCIENTISKNFPKFIAK